MVFNSDGRTTSNLETSIETRLETALVPNHVVDYDCSEICPKEFNCPDVVRVNSEPSILFHKVAAVLKYLLFYNFLL